MTELVFVVPFDGADVTSSTAMIRVEDRIDAVSETVTVHQFTPAAATHLMRPVEAWTWSELRDYVVGKIIEIHGVFPRNNMKEGAIFKAFCTRWGDDAPAIARYAFESMGGYWKNAPVSVNRFCKGSDPYFAQLIVDHLNWNVRP
jgi:hypothetical protein